MNENDIWNGNSCTTYTEWKVISENRCTGVLEVWAGGRLHRLSKRDMALRIGETKMAIELHHLNTHEMMEQAGKVLDGVVRLKARIVELEKEIAELKEAQRWRKFSEEKPEEKQWILVFVENPSEYGTYIELRRWDLCCKFYVENQELYTKWMPLPSAPKEEKC